MSKFAQIAKKHYEDGDWSRALILNLREKGRLTTEEVAWILGE